MALAQVDDYYGKEFQEMKTQPQDFMDEIKGRQICPKCNKSRKFYCYSCYILMDELQNKLKTVKLPVKVDIIKHRNEVDGKSTAPHARVIAPDDVNIYQYPCIPDYDRNKVILVFPCEESVPLGELSAPKTRSCTENFDGVHHDEGKHNSAEAKENGEHQVQNTERTKGDDSSNPSEDQSPDSNKRKLGFENCASNKVAKTDLKSQIKYESSDNKDVQVSAKHSWKLCPSFEKVVFIDSTWLQAKTIFSDERLKDLRKVELKTRQTKFWRPQGDHPDTYLATIEAIYYFIKDFHTTFISDLYNGDYDNLLFFFLYTYSKIQKSEDSKKICKR